MVKITNNTTRTLNFPIEGHTNESNKTDSIKAGESKDIDVDVKSPHVVGYLHSNAISIGGKQAKAALATAAENPKK